MNDQSRPGRPGKWPLVSLLFCVVIVICGCRTARFYGQAIQGEFQILTHEESIERLLSSPQTPERLKEQLRLVEDLRDFAARELGLPVDGQYSRYVDVHRPYAVWNVQASPEFSLQPKAWWYPIVGRLEYRGYFSERDARDDARRTEQRGFDVCVEGVEAYSTLGWFKDPVLNTFLFRQEPDLAEVLFHELGHQRVFAHGDTDFNEAFATTVGQEGARRWVRSRGSTDLCGQYLVALQRNDEFVRMVMKTRERLETLYGDTLDSEGKVKAAGQPPASPARLRFEKERIFDELRCDYEGLKSEWGGDPGYDAWFGSGLNNARLNTIANYFDYVPAFERLLQLNGGDLERFYEAVRLLAKMPRKERHRRLRDLAAGSPGLP
jgi:predicted aminopeptidase